MNIYESIAAIQADIDFIGKDKQTQSGAKFKYRGVDQVLNTLHPLFAKHKVFAVPEVLEILSREERTTNNGGVVLCQVLKVRYTFYAEDGTSVTAVVVGEAMDSGDKVSNKCMSVAYKYACFQVLSIPTEETAADPDDDNKPLPPKKQGAVQPPAEQQKAPQNANDEATQGNKPKTRLQQVRELIKGTVFTIDNVNSFIESKCGEPKSIDEITEAQFEYVMKTIKHSLNVAQAQED